MIDFINVSKVYQVNGAKALDNINLHIDKGEFVFIVGASGAGKSTFLKTIMREEVASSGEVIFDGENLNTMKARRVPFYRRKLGIVFQDFRLIPSKTVYENVAFAMHVIGASQKDISRRVAYALSLVGLSAKAKSLPNQLSGGEQQRVALARALVNDADVIIADEPTGNIDPEMSKDIVDLLEQINLNKNTTIIMVTHEVDLIRSYNKRIITIKNGQIISDTAHPEVAQTVELKEEPVQNSPSGYYHAPTEDAEIEHFLMNYGNEADNAESSSTEDLSVDPKGINS